MNLGNNNNVGINAPEVEWSFEPEVDWIDITTVHKGGLFGTDYRMLFPGDGIDGIVVGCRRRVVERDLHREQAAAALLDGLHLVG